MRNLLTAGGLKKRAFTCQVEGGTKEKVSFLAGGKVFASGPKEGKGKENGPQDKGWNRFRFLYTSSDKSGTPTGEKWRMPQLGGEKRIRRKRTVCDLKGTS